MSKDCSSERAKFKDILVRVSELAQRSKGFLPYQIAILVERGEGRGLPGPKKKNVPYFSSHQWLTFES